MSLSDEGASPSMLLRVYERSLFSRGRIGYGVDVDQKASCHTYEWVNELMQRRRQSLEADMLQHLTADIQTLQ